MTFLAHRQQFDATKFPYKINLGKINTVTLITTS